MTIVFDKNTENERTVTMQYTNEQPMINRMTANTSVRVEEGTVFPDISAISQNKNFETIECLSSDGVEVPLYGTYTHISGITTSYTDSEKVLNINIVIEGDSE